MAKELGTYEPQLAKDMVRAVRDLRRRPQRHSPLSGDWPGFPAREIRWGKTTTNGDYPTYPTEGNVFLCELGDVYPSAETFNQFSEPTFTGYDPAEYILAVDYSRLFWIEGAIVPVMRIDEYVDGTNNLPMWWICSTSRAVKAVATADISAGSYGTADLYYGGTANASVDAYFNWMTGTMTEITTGTEMLVQWFPDEEKWVIINAEC